MKRSLLLKYLRGETSAPERIEVLHWLDDDPANMEEFRHLRQIFDASLCNGDEFSIVNPARRSYGQYIRIAATFALLCVLAAALFFSGYYSSRNSSALLATNISVPVGQRTEITLSDGTTVWLNSNTSLHVPSSNDGSSRHVVIDGEAYFEVSHDPKHPFIVSTGKYQVTVLGTKFNVSAYSSSNKFSTRLFEGAVEVLALADSARITLKPNEEAIIAENGKLIKESFSDGESPLWIKGIYYFENEDYATIFRKMEEYYKVRIDVRNPEILDYRCTCKFRQEDGLRHVIEALQQIHHFNYKWTTNNESVIISNN
ncbi:MAG: FecR domain-containing protein [Muribaculaceae bacterium]